MDTRNLELTFFITLMVLVSVLLVLIFLPYFNAIVLGLTFTILAYPFYSRISRKLGGREGLASGITTFLASIAILIPLLLCGVLIFKELNQLYQIYFAEGYKSLAGFERILPGFTEYTRRGLEWLLGNIGFIFSSVTTVALTLVLSLFSLYYFLKDGDRLRAVIVRISPLTEKDSNEILEHLHYTAVSVLKGSLIVSIIQGIVAGIGLFIFGVPLPALWGLATIFAALIPMLGTTIIMLPIVIYMLLTNNLFAAVGLFFWWLLFVGLIDNLLYPKLLERRVQIHPFLILLSVLGGISFFGIMGFLLGPLLLGLFMALLNLYPTIILKRGRDVHPD